MRRAKPSCVVSVDHQDKFGGAKYLIDIDMSYLNVLADEGVVTLSGELTTDEANATEFGSIDQGAYLIDYFDWKLVKASHVRGCRCACNKN